MSIAGVWLRRRCSGLVLTALLTAALLWPIFKAGAFFPGTVALAALAAGFALAAWIVLARRPFAGATVPLGVAVGGLALLAAWTLASQAWSDAAGRALLEFDRALLYALAAALAGLAAAVPAVRRSVPRAVAAALVLACAAGLVTRLLPGVWPIGEDVSFGRLSFPLTYWNGQGALAALALVACLHLASDLRERRAVRALAAAAMPVVATCLLFTFSRGAILVAPLGLGAYLLLARPRGGVSALAAIVPSTAVAVALAYEADAVARANTAAQLPIAQGRTLALAVAACAAAAALVLLALGPLDRRVARWRPPALGPRWRRGLVAGAVAAVIVAGVAADAPARISAEADRLTAATFVEGGPDQRGRLTSLADNGRVDQWHVAVDAFSAQPLRGSGAGTYALLWTQNRASGQEVTDGHSLYLEVLAELGLVGGLLLAAALGGLLVGSARRLRGEDRPLAAVALALLLTWGVHAGIDWDWELPGLTLPVLVVAAAAAGGRARTAPGVRTAALPRALAAAAAIALLIAPVGIVRSQSRLDAAVADLRAGRCDTAVAEARGSIAAVSSRAEPFQVLALCEARLGHGAAAIAAMRAAVRRDPANWRLLYGLAVMRAVEGLDPRPQLREARLRNPHSELVGAALERFDSGRRADWREQALQTPVPL